jgi:hypothetical protein
LVNGTAVFRGSNAATSVSIGVGDVLTLVYSANTTYIAY